MYITHEKSRRGGEWTTLHRGCGTYENLGFYLDGRWYGWECYPGFPRMWAVELRAQAARELLTRDEFCVSGNEEDLRCALAWRRESREMEEARR